MRDDLEDALELYGGMPPAGQEHWFNRSLPSVTFESDTERNEFIAALHKLDKPREASHATPAPVATQSTRADFRPGQRVKVNLMGLSADGVQFSQNVESVYATIVGPIAATPPAYHVKLLIIFHGVSELNVPADRIRPI